MLMLWPTESALSISEPRSVAHLCRLTELEKTCCGVDCLDKAWGLRPWDSEVGKDDSGLDIFQHQCNEASFNGRVTLLPTSHCIVCHKIN